MKIKSQQTGEKIPILLKNIKEGEVFRFSDNTNKNMIYILTDELTMVDLCSGEVFSLPSNESEVVLIDGYFQITNEETFL